MTNWEKYFGSPEKTANAMARPTLMTVPFGFWLEENKGSKEERELTMRGNNKTSTIESYWREWLHDEAM